MNDDALQLWLRKHLPTGLVDAGLAMATWPKALMVLVSRRDDLIRVAKFLTETARLEFGRLTLILLNTAVVGDTHDGGISERALDAEFGPFGFAPFTRKIRTLRSRMPAASYVDTSRTVDSEFIIEFNSVIRGILPASVLAVPGSVLPTVSMVGTFDRIWCRSPALQQQMATLRDLMRPNARMLLSVREDTTLSNRVSGATIAAESLGLDAHIVGQSLMPSEENEAPREVKVTDGSQEEVIRAIHSIRRDLLIQSPSATATKFRVSCYCCQ